MSEVVVKPVASRADRKRFLNFPWVLYQGDPNWIPPLRQNQKEMVGYAHNPFYDENEIQTFLAWREDEVVGRVGAILNRTHNERYQEERGFFGFFESIDDPEVANRLFDAVRQWFDQRGIHKLRGPMNPSMNHELGLLVAGFDSPPTFMMTYNPEYYGRLIENFGFEKSQDLYAYWGHIDMFPKVRDKLGPVCAQIKEHLGAKVRILDKSRFLEDVELFLDIFNRAMSNTWGFVPMSAAEIRHTAKGLRHLMIPELALAVEIDGKPAGAVFALPDYNPRIKQIDGRLFPLGFIRLLWRKERIKRVRVISTNVLPEYQLQGLGLVLLDALAPQAMGWGVEEAEFSWVLESNSLSRGSLEKGGAELVRTYRIYDLDS